MLAATRQNGLMPPWLQRWIPDRQSLERNRWLRWLGPALHHPRLWHVSRRGLALGVAIGVFFGLLIPIAQIPLSVGAAVALRANVPAAATSTLVSNPFTYGPLYYIAWRIGSAILHEPVPAGSAPPPPPEVVDEPAPDESWWTVAWRRITGVGKPLLLGMATMATVCGLLTYFAIAWLWALKIHWTRRRRRRRLRGLRRA
jgi:uncharacterized protein (DUF2062 family)